MATMVDTYTQESDAPRLRHGVGAAVVLAHLGMIGSLLIPPAPPAAPAVDTMMVTFVAPPQEEAAPPPPASKVEKQPPVLTSKRQIEAAPDAPVIPVEPLPVPVTPSEQEAPPVPAPPALMAASPVPAPANDTKVAILYIPKAMNKFLLPAGVKYLTVRVRARVNTRGRAEKISLEASSGNKDADIRALQDVRDYRFRPAMKAGVPVEEEAVFGIKYEK